MINSGLVTLGRDAELKHTNTGVSILGFSGAYSVGFGERKETVWIKCTIFGKQAEALAQYLLKGTKIVIHGKDIKINTWDKNDGTQGVSLECIVNDIEFTGSNQQNQQNQQAQQQSQNFQQPQQQARPPFNPPSLQSNAQNNRNQQDDFTNADDDIPF